MLSRYRLVQSMEWGIVLKLSKLFSLYTSWLLISAALTMASVLIGFYITHKLTEDDRDRAMGSPARTFHQLVIDSSIKGKMSLDEAYEMVDNAYGEKFPFTRQLIDPVTDKLDEEDVIFERYPLPDGREIIFYRDRRFPHPPPHKDKGAVAFRPPPHGKTGPFRRGTFYIGMITMVCSIVAGIGFSMGFIGLYLRKKSKQAEKIISRLKSGDLKARFDLSKADEASQLMINFNQMADAIEGLVENLRKTELARKTLLQELAHDLRTPVASLKNLQEILIEKGDLLSADKKRHVQEMAINEVVYFERLVEDLLFLSGVNDPKYDQHFAKVNFSFLIKQEIEIIETDHLSVLFQGQEDIEIMGNEHLLRRLLKNVFSNASRFSQKLIEVHLKIENSQVILTVIDDGPGMDEQMLGVFGEKKFSRQIDPANKDYISIGLGSVIMKKIMDLHEGVMRVENRENPRGCKISLQFKSL
jgi:signal transduction histidine kinase